jgi:DNA-binding response OmpR family regulator
MQSLKLIYDEGSPNFSQLIKESLESSGRFIVFLEKENYSKEVSQEIGNYVFNAKMRTLQWSEEEIQSVTYKENEILRLLLENANNLVTRSLILTSFWGEISFYTSRSLDIFIYHLRKKLKKDPAIAILTMRGEGFILKIKSE